MTVSLQPSRAYQGADALSLYSGEGTRAWLVTFMAVCVAWLIAHPYVGIQHDGQLYALQALNRIQPEIFGRDLYFAFGSQDDYTLFTPLFEQLVRLIGLGNSSLVATALGQVLWLAGATALVVRLIPQRAGTAAALLLVAAMPAFYGGLSVLMYGEGFVTPRLFAEAATLWALWFVLEGRKTSALLAILAATALHPPYGAACLAIVVIYLGFSDRRWWLVLAAGALAVAALAHAGLAPFDRLLATFDEAWLDVLRQRNPMVFPGEWLTADWARIGVMSVTLLAGASTTGGDTRRIFLAALLTALGGLAISVIGADVLRNVLVTQLQIFRATWLLQVFGHVALGVLLCRLWQQRTNAGPLSAVAAVGWIGLWLWPAPGALLAAASSVLLLAQVQGRLLAFNTLSRLICYSALAACLLVVIPARIMAALGRMHRLEGEGTGWQHALDHVFMVEALLLAVVLAVAVRIWRPRIGGPAIAAGLAIMLVAVMSWDRRDSRDLSIERGQAAPDMIDRIPPDANVFWEGGSQVPWFLLRRPLYVAQYQGAGAVFSREFSMEYLRRAQSLAPLGRDVVDRTLRFGADTRTPEFISRQALVETCRSARALDLLVLTRRVEGAFEARWVLADAGPSRRPRFGPRPFVHYLYDCRRLRGEG